MFRNMALLKLFACILTNFISHRRLFSIVNNYCCWWPCDPRSQVISSYIMAWWRHDKKSFPRYWPFVRGIHQSLVGIPSQNSNAGFDAFFYVCRVKLSSKKASCKELKFNKVLWYNAHQLSVQYIIIIQVSVGNLYRNWWSTIFLFLHSN